LLLFVILLPITVRGIMRRENRRKESNDGKECKPSYASQNG